MRFLTVSMIAGLGLGLELSIGLGLCLRLGLGSGLGFVHLLTLVSIRRFSLPLIDGRKVILRPRQRRQLGQIFLIDIGIGAVEFGGQDVVVGYPFDTDMTSGEDGGGFRGAFPESYFVEESHKHRVGLAYNFGQIQGSDPRTCPRNRIKRKFVAEFSEPYWRQLKKIPR